MSNDISNQIKAIKIFDSTGRLIKNIENVNSTEVKLNLSDILVKGYFVVKLETDKGLAIKRFFKS